METLGVLFHDYGLLIVFLWVLAEALGAPFPSLPLLMAVGAMAAAGGMTLLTPLFVTVLATMLGDVVWYAIGWKKGRPVLHLMCRLSMNPDACILQTENVFQRYGAAALLFSKFIPGLSTVTAPVAGHMRMPHRRFLLFDLAGAVLWASSLLGLGYWLRREVHRLGPSITMANHTVLVIVVLALGGLLIYKCFNHFRRQQEQGIPKVEPAALWAELEAGKQVLFLDVRDPIQLGQDSVRIRGAVSVPRGDILRHLNKLSSQRPIIVYCA